MPARHHLAIVSEQRLSAREQRVWEAFRKLGEKVMSRVASEIESTTGLSATEFGVLSHLEDLGHGELRQQELGASMGWDKSRLSHQLTRMESRRLVKRTTNPDRSVLVSILAPGRKAIAGARPVFAASVRRHFLERVTDSEAKCLIEIFSRVVDSE